MQTICPCKAGTKYSCKHFVSRLTGLTCLVIKKVKAMYVIAEIQGQQFKLEEGRKLFVHHIKEAESGSEVSFDRVLLADKDGQVTVGVPTIEGAKVVCEVLSPTVKGDKVLVFHKKRRKGYRKLKGHRQQFTELRVKSIVA